KEDGRDCRLPRRPRAAPSRMCRAPRSGRSPGTRLHDEGASGPLAASSRAYEISLACDGDAEAATAVVASAGAWPTRGRIASRCGGDAALERSAHAADRQRNAVLGPVEPDPALESPLRRAARAPSPPRALQRAPQRAAQVRLLPARCAHALEPARGGAG